MKRLLIILLILSTVLLCACATSPEPKPFPPPEGYSSWDEYYEEYYEEHKPSIEIPSPPTPSPIPQPEPEPQPELSASIKIKHWQQDYYEYFEEWGYVEVFYKLENTGDIDIDYYEVYFIVECSGGKEYYDWTNGLNVDVGDKISDHLMIDTAGKEAESVEIDDWNLEYH